MFHAFKQRASAKDANVSEKHTRFKRMHLRETPEHSNTCGLDSYGKLSRMSPHHTRSLSQSEREPKSKPQPRQISEMDLRASLHSSEPIGINVLHNALPLRAAQVHRKK